MGVNNTGIGSYLAAMNKRMGVRGSAAELMQRNSYNSVNAAGNAQIAKTNNNAYKEEGAVEADTKLPPPGDVGRIMDFKC